LRIALLLLGSGVRANFGGGSLSQNLAFPKQRRVGLALALKYGLMTRALSAAGRAGRMNDDAN
jgi:hypothetical protein